MFAFSGFAFPLGVMFYWLTSNIWTMVQQFLVIRNMPTPGSEAALAREARLAKTGTAQGNHDRRRRPAPRQLEEAEDAPQRQQPVSKNRAKKKPGGKK